jgi:hypothetical protein
MFEKKMWYSANAGLASSRAKRAAFSSKRREGGKEGRREGGREGGRVGGWEGGREGGRVTISTGAQICFEVFLAP